MTLPRVGSAYTLVQLSLIVALCVALNEYVNSFTYCIVPVAAYGAMGVPGEATSVYSREVTGVSSIVLRSIVYGFSS
jgi:hypothetical protein